MHVDLAWQKSQAPGSALDWHRMLTLRTQNQSCGFVIPLLCPKQQPHWVLCEPRHHICGVDRLHRIFDGQIRRGSEEQDWYTLNAKDLVSWRWTRNGRPTEAFRHFSIAQIIRGWIYLKEVGSHCQCKCRQDMVNCHDQKAVDAGRECTADLDYKCIKHSLCNIVVVSSKRCMVHFGMWGNIKVQVSIR